MNLRNIVQALFNTFKWNGRYRDGEMKRVFQWRRYLEWKDLTSEEKLSAKRILFVPIVSYLLFVWINEYIITISFFMLLYLLYKKLEKGKITK